MKFSLKKHGLIFQSIILVSSIFNVTAAEKVERLKLSENTKQEIIKVLETNDKLHDTFFNYNGDLIEKNAKSLSESISSIKDKDISNLLNFANKKLQEIKASNEKEKNNELYHIVSTALIYIVNKYDVGDKYNAYSCPMVKKKWIQNSQSKDEVQNPYAANMPNCGTKDSNF